YQFLLAQGSEDIWATSTQTCCKQRQCRSARRARRTGGEQHMDFQITNEHRRLQERCRLLAEDFATRAAEHDRLASHPLENYAALRREGFYALNIPKDFGGQGVGLLGY